MLVFSMTLLAVTSRPVSDDSIDDSPQYSGPTRQDSQEIKLAVT